MNEKKKLPLPLIILIIGIIIGLLFALFGLYKQYDAKKTNDERYNQAYAESQAKVDAANERLAEIEKEYTETKTQYDEKADECDSIVTGSDDWFSKKSKCNREEQELQDTLWDLEAEKTTINNKDYTVYYQLVEPMSYQIFYIIGASIAAVAALASFIIYLVKGKKSY
jgi:predicted  nucleic acid-binding Zn-ribbon protein